MYKNLKASRDHLCFSLRTRLSESSLTPENLESFGSGVTVGLLFSTIAQCDLNKPLTLSIKLQRVACPAVLKKTSQNIRKSLSTSAHMSLK